MARQRAYGAALYAITRSVRKRQRARLGMKKRRAAVVAARARVYAAVARAWYWRQEPMPARSRRHALSEDGTVTRAEPIRC